MGKKDKRIKELEDRVERIEEEIQAMRDAEIANLKSRANYYGMLSSALHFPINDMYGNSIFDTKEN